MTDKTRAIVGCLLGTAVGDALGLPYEGLSKHRQHRAVAQIRGHNLIFGKGMVSDDTEHICMVAQSLIVSATDEKQFVRALSWRLRFWLLGLPAGIGSATLKAIIKLWLGFGSDRSGVFSAGNGSAMRSYIIGVVCGNNPQKLRSLVKASTRLTHSDPKAEYGALAVAIAAYLSSHNSFVSPQTYYQTLQDYLGTEGEDLLSLINQSVKSAIAQESKEVFANRLGCTNGIGGYIYHTVPVVIQIWLRHQQDYQQGIL